MVRACSSSGSVWRKPSRTGANGSLTTTTFAPESASTCATSSGVKAIPIGVSNWPSAEPRPGESWRLNGPSEGLI